MPASGNMLIINNRIDWSRSYLKQADLLLYPAGGMDQITPEGSEVLGLDLPKINLKLLREKTDFLKNRREPSQQKPSSHNSAELQTPQQLIENGIAEIENVLKSDLLDTLKMISPYRFEKIVIDLLQKMGHDGHNIREKW